MEPKSHLIEKEHNLPSTSIFGFHVHFQGCIFGIATVAKKGTIFNDETRKRVEILKDFFYKHMMMYVFCFPI